MKREQTDRQQRQQPPVVQHAAETSILATPETALAAYLLVKGRRLERIEDDPGERMLSFIFVDVAPGDVEAFRGGDLVPAVDFAKASQKVHQIVRSRRVERNTLRQRPTESEVPALQQERGQGLTMSKRLSVFVTAALLVVVAGCAKHPAPCTPYGGVLTLDRHDCRLPAEPAQKDRVPE